jgi:hypothetical protein
MIRWVAVIFVGLFIFLPLFPELYKLRLGCLPGDVRFRVKTLECCLPFGSTLAVSAVAFLCAELLRLL